MAFLSDKLGLGVTLVLICAAGAGARFNAVRVAGRLGGNDPFTIGMCKLGKLNIIMQIIRFKCAASYAVMSLCSC